MGYPKTCPKTGILKLIYMVDHWVQLLLKGVTIVCLATVVLIVFLQIFCRSFLGFSFRWVDEFARWTNIYAAMCGGALCYRYRGLTGFSSVVDRLNRRAQIVIRYINDIIVCAFCVFALIGGKRVLDVVISFGQKSSVTKMPMAVPYFVIILAFGSILLFSINMIVFGLCKVDDGNSYEEDDESKTMGVIQ